VAVNGLAIGALAKSSSCLTALTRRRRKYVEKLHESVSLSNATSLTHRPVNSGESIALEVEGTPPGFADDYAYLASGPRLYEATFDDQLFAVCRTVTR